MSKGEIPLEQRLRARVDAEERNIFSRLPAIYAASRTQGQRILKQVAGLSIVEWRTLWDLNSVGPLTVQQLAYIQRADHSQLSRALPPMRDKGYITMARGTEDARQMIVTLTDAGRQKFLEASPTMARRRQSVRDCFTPDEMDQFIAFLDRYEALLHRPVETFLAPRSEQKETAP